MFMRFVLGQPLIMTMRFARQQPLSASIFHKHASQYGFGLIEVAFAIVLISIMLVPILTGGLGSTVTDDQTVLTATENLSQTIVSGQNLVNQIASMQNSAVLAALPSTPGSTTRIPGSGTNSYTDNGQTIYWYINVKEMSNRVSTSGGLIDRDGSSVSSGSAVRVVPQGNNLYYGTLVASENADGSDPFLTNGFYIQSTSCSGGVCPAIGTETSYLVDQADRFGIDVSG